MSNRHEMEQPDELTAWFEAYRSACPDPTASPSFMPGVWARIESRRRSTQLFGIFAKRLLAGAAALTVAMGLLLYGPFDRFNQHNANTYLDALADDHQELAAADIPTMGDHR